MTLITGFTAAYAGLVGNIFSAIVDLPGPTSTPGVPAPMPQGAIFLALLVIVIPTTFISFGLMLFGMRGEGPEVRLKPDATYDTAIKTA